MCYIIIALALIRDYYKCWKYNEKLRLQHKGRHLVGNDIKVSVATLQFKRMRYFEKNPDKQPKKKLTQFFLWPQHISYTFLINE